MIAVGECLKIFPESLSIFFILSDVIGAAQRKCPAKARGFPNEFNIMNGKQGKGNGCIAGFVIGPMMKRFVES